MVNSVPLARAILAVYTYLLGIEMILGLKIYPLVVGQRGGLVSPPHEDHSAVSREWEIKVQANQL